MGRFTFCDAGTHVWYSNVIHWWFARLAKRRSVALGTCGSVRCRWRPACVWAGRQRAQPQVGIAWSGLGWRRVLFHLSLAHTPVLDGELGGHELGNLRI